MSSLTRWDHEISPFLRIMESRSNWLAKDAVNVANHAMTLCQAVKMLPCKPEFETRAIAGLVEAERVLIAALESVRHTRELYHAKPSERDYMDAAE